MNSIFVRKTMFFAIFLLVVGFIIGGEEGESFQNDSFVSPPEERWTITTRWDYGLHKDNQYVGFANRELREIFRLVETQPKGWQIHLNAFLLGDIKKNGKPVAARLESRRVSQFLLKKDGELEDGEEGPWLRGFPVFPEGKIQKGDTWEAPLKMRIYGAEGDSDILNLLALYTYTGEQLYQGRPSRLFKIEWALRYEEDSLESSGILQNVEGRHEVALVTDAQTGAPVLARDRLWEIYTWADGSKEKRKGFALLFWKGIPPLNTGLVKEEIKKNLLDAVDLSDKDIVVTSVPDGISLTLKNLHFKPDQATLLSTDRPLLDKLSKTLLNISNHTILIRGHTAETGRPREQKKLSEDRAKVIADELSTRGVDPRRLIYEGVGAKEPNSDNSTEEGRRANRRVEVIILED